MQNITCWFIISICSLHRACASQRKSMYPAWKKMNDMCVTKHVHCTSAICMGFAFVIHQASVVCQCAFKWLIISCFINTKRWVSFCWSSGYEKHIPCESVFHLKHSLGKCVWVCVCVWDIWTLSQPPEIGLRQWATGSVVDWIHRNRLVLMLCRAAYVVTKLLNGWLRLYLNISCTASNGINRNSHLARPIRGVRWATSCPSPSCCPSPARRRAPTRRSNTPCGRMVW